MMPIGFWIGAVASLAWSASDAAAQEPRPWLDRWEVLIEHEGVEVLSHPFGPRIDQDFVTRVNAAIQFRIAGSTEPSWLANVEVDCANTEFRILSHHHYDAEGRPTRLEIGEVDPPWVPAASGVARLWVERLCEVASAGTIFRFLPNG